METLRTLRDSKSHSWQPEVLAVGLVASDPLDLAVSTLALGGRLVHEVFQANHEVLFAVSRMGGTQLDPYLSCRRWHVGVGAGEEGLVELLGFILIICGDDQLLELIGVLLDRERRMGHDAVVAN